jgi:hypothetical protein
MPVRRAPIAVGALVGGALGAWMAGVPAQLLVTVRDGISASASVAALDGAGSVRSLILQVAAAAWPALAGGCAGAMAGALLQTGFRIRSSIGGAWRVRMPELGAAGGGVARMAWAVVLMGGTTRDGFDRSVWSLSPGDRPVWTRLDGAADVLPRSGSALPWDPVACGFLVVGGRCADQVWLLRPEDTGIREAMLGTMQSDPRSMGLGRIAAGVVFDPGQRALVAIAGNNRARPPRSPTSTQRHDTMLDLRPGWLCVEE